MLAAEAEKIADQMRELDDSTKINTNSWKTQLLNTRKLKFEPLLVSIKNTKSGSKRFTQTMLTSAGHSILEYLFSPSSSLRQILLR